MFLEADWEGFCHAGSAGNQSMAPLGVVFPNGVKNTLISAAKLGGFLQWGGPRWCAEFWWLAWSDNFMVVGESFGRHGWVGLGWMFVAGLHFFSGKAQVPAAQLFAYIFNWQKCLSGQRALWPH